MTAEEQGLKEPRERTAPWKRWAPYLSMSISTETPVLVLAQVIKRDGPVWLPNCYN